MRSARLSTMIRTTLFPTSAAFALAMLVSTNVAFAQRGYVRSDGVNAVVYPREVSELVSDVFELSLLDDGWHVADLTEAAGAPATPDGLTPVPYVRSDGINAVVYTGFDSHIHELALVAGLWRVGDLSLLAGAPPAASGPAPYVRSDGINAVVYTHNDGHIYELTLVDGLWQFGDLSAPTGAPRPASGPAPYVRSDGVNSVVYAAFDLQIWELYLIPGDPQWHVGDLTAQAGG